MPCVCSVIDHRWRQNVVKTKLIQWKEKKKKTHLPCTTSYLLYLTCIQFLSKKFFKAFTCPKQNNHKDIFKTARHFQVISVCLIVLFVNSSCYTFFKAFTLLMWSNLANIFKTTRHVEQNVENKFPVTASMFNFCTLIDHGHKTNISARWIDYIV